MQPTAAATHKTATNGSQQPLMIHRASIPICAMSMSKPTTNRRVRSLRSFFLFAMMWATSLIDSTENRSTFFRDCFKYITLRYKQYVTQGDIFEMQRIH